MPVTLREIARHLSLSESTVSRALNNDPRVREETRRRVLEAARVLKYRPNAVARSLATQKSRVIGLVISDIANPFFAAVVAGVEALARQHAYGLLLANTGGDPEQEIRYIRTLAERRVEGILFMSGRLPFEVAEALRESSLPVVTVERDASAYGFPSVRIDNQKESAAAVQYLINLGHRRIACITGTLSDAESGYARLEGYRAALQAAGIPYDPALVVEGDFRMESGFRAMQLLLRVRPRPTAVFAASDAMAIGAIKAARAAGLSVPDDLAVVGFDNTILATVSTPALTTVAQPLFEIGETATRLLLRLAAGEAVPDSQVFLPCQLVIRESCGGTRLAAARGGETGKDNRPETGTSEESSEQRPVATDHRPLAFG